MPIRVGKYYRKKDESAETEFQGTIIDIETIGEFYGPRRDVPQLGSDYLARYKSMKITTVGVLSDNRLTIHIANGSDSLNSFQRIATEIMMDTTKPRYAFNKTFEEGCYFWNSGRRFLDFEYELQQFPLEKKEDAVRLLRINNYGDPYHGDGYRCKDAFLAGNLRSIIKHNRACLLKENQILEKRGAEKVVTKWIDIDKI